MAALQSWRKAYGALKDTTTVSLANLNSDFKVRRRILTHPPVLSPDFAGAKAVQFVSRRSCARRRIYGRAAAPHWVYWFSLACFFFVFSGSGCRDREGHQPRGEPAQGAPPAQCVDSSHVLPSHFFFA
jgi:hypothetical protein